MFRFFKIRRKAYLQTIKLHKKNDTLMIAHRGLSGIRRENTLPAFELAGKHSYYGIETDMHVTSDGKFVIIHDDDTSRVSNKNYKVEKTDFDTLRSIKLNNLRTGKPDDELKIPTLEEYILVCKKYDKVSFLELKNPFKREHIEQIVKIIDGLDCLDKVVFISFDLNNLIVLRELLHEQKIMYLTDEFNEKIFNILKKYNFGIDAQYPVITEEIVKKLHSEKIPVNVWTCNKHSDGKKLISAGVDYITTNILE